MKRQVRKEPPIRDAPKIRIPEALLLQLDEEAERFAPGANMSRIQMVSVAISEWLQARRVERKAKAKDK
jgi:hypothetical protein